jgi:hypothetical protein
MLHHAASQGAGGIVIPAYPVVNVYLTTWLPGATTTLAVVAGSVYLTPIIVAKRRTFTGAAINVTVLSTGGARVGIFEAKSDGMPGALIVEPTAGTPLDMTSASIKTTPAYSQDLAPGLYWAGVCFEATPTVTSSGAGNHVGAVMQAGVVSVLRGLLCAWPYAPLGSLAAITPTASGTSVPIVGIK